MGCGASSRAPVEGAEHQAPVREATPHAILIEKAQKLSRDVDIMGPADPFVIIRLGPVGAAWSAKARETERVSDTCWNTVSPTWNFAFRFAAPPPGADWELHCRVFDKDDLSSDDFMCECMVCACMCAVSLGDVHLLYYGRSVDGICSMVDGAYICICTRSCAVL